MTAEPGGLARFSHFQALMLEKLKKSWQTFKRASPGHRFERQYQSRKRSAGSSIVLTGMGLLLLAAGIVLLFIPGPGLLLIAFGGGLIARQSLPLARRLDRLELVLRKVGRKSRRSWERSSSVVRVAIATAVSVGILGLAFLGYVWIFRR
jgi:Putative transmembrane protein (PGPGW)